MYSVIVIIAYNVIVVNAYIVIVEMYNVRHALSFTQYWLRVLKLCRVKGEMFVKIVVRELEVNIHNTTVLQVCLCCLLCVSLCACVVVCLLSACLKLHIRMR